jgi:hypothetical protein
VQATLFGVTGHFRSPSSDVSKDDSIPERLFWSSLKLVRFRTQKKPGRAVDANWELDHFWDQQHLPAEAAIGERLLQAKQDLC